MDIIFWINTPSLHQAPLIRSVAEKAGGRVLAISSSELPDSRLNLGWGAVDFGEAVDIREPSDEERRRIVQEFCSSAVHIVTGAFTEPSIARTTKSLISAGAVVLCQTEAWDRTGLKGAIRNVLYAARFRKLARHDLSGVLAMGENGVEAVVCCNFPRSRVFEFGYFVDRPKNLLPKERSGVIFVAGLNKWKRPFDILNVARLLPWIDFSIVGTGPLEQSLKKSIRGVENVHFLGALPNSEVRDFISRHRLLLLPSNYDGWGAVVNEALSAGTPVLCSEAVGAKSLLTSDEGPWRGNVIEVGDVQSMSELISNALAHTNETIHENIAAWADSRIAPDIAADYLLAVCKNLSEASGGAVVAPSAPWRRANQAPEDAG